MARAKPSYGILGYYKRNGMSFFYAERKVKLDLKKRLSYLDYVAEHDRLERYIQRTVKKFVYNKFPTWDTSKYIVTTTLAANVIRIELVSKKGYEPNGIQECINDAIMSLQFPDYE